MAVLGYNTIGGTQRNSIGYPFTCKFTPTQGGTIDDIVVYADTPQGYHTVTVALFADNAGQPGTLLAYSGTQSGDGTAKWFTFSSLTEVSVGNLVISNGTPIHLAAWTSDNGTDVKWRFDSGSTGQAHYIFNLGSYPTWGNATSIGGPESDNMSIYANYTASAGGTKKLALLGVG